MSQMAVARGFHGRGPVGQHRTRSAHQTCMPSHLTRTGRSVDHGVQRFMKPGTRFAAGVCFLLVLATALQGAGQDPPVSAPKPQPSPLRSDVQTRITIEVTGGEKDAPVENASVYVKYIEEHAIKKDKKLELNVKTSREGLAHVPNAPMGRVMVQVIAEGWKTYGRWLDITDPKQTIKVHLERPPKWY